MFGTIWSHRWLSYMIMGPFQFRCWSLGFFPFLCFTIISIFLLLDCSAPTPQEESTWVSCRPEEMTAAVMTQLCPNWTDWDLVSGFYWWLIMITGFQCIYCFCQCCCSTVLVCRTPFVSWDFKKTRCIFLFFLLHVFWRLLSHAYAPSSDYVMTCRSAAQWNSWSKCSALVDRLSVISF